MSDCLQFHMRVCVCVLAFVSRCSDYFTNLPFSHSIAFSSSVLFFGQGVAFFFNHGGYCKLL